MSTIKVNKIENTATADGGIAIDANGHVQVDGVQMPTAGALSSRNMVDNGAMVISQRGTSESGLTDSPKFVVDRFSYRRAGSWGTNSFTMSQQSSGAPDGFTHFLRLAQSGTAAAPPANTYCSFATYLEGFNIASAGFGTSAAKDLTLSFYAKASQAGTYCFQLANQGSTQTYLAEYSVTTSWQRITISIPARTVGTWYTDNTQGFNLNWIIAADSDGTTFVGSTGWNTSDVRYTSNQSEAFASNAGATFDLCGVQLEVGEKSTEFEHRSYGDELARCQRYRYQIDLGDNTSVQHIVMTRFEASSGDAYAHLTFPCEMRSNPNFSFTGTSHSATGYAGDPILNKATKTSCDIRSTRSVSANSCVFLRAVATANGSDVLILNFDSEL